MGLRVRLGVAIALPYAIQASQAPFQLPSSRAASWEDLRVRPDINATGNFIFEEVNSLLQHWPNTRYRNGHSIVPGTIPIGTLLYHGRANSSMPSTPEWTSTDPEHSYNFCDHEMASADNTSGCWHLTVVATRPLKVLYFDGSSAANMKDGTLDAQDLLVWGDVDPARWAAEREKITKMCAWGKQFGIDGYLRMEMDFEVMLCDFHKGVELVSADFLQSWVPRHPKPPLWTPYPPPPPPEFNRTTETLRFEAVRAGAWHNHYPGETRAVLDLTRLVSFYDPSLAPSLVAHRSGKGRWDHRVQNISAADLAAVHERLKSLLDPRNTEVGSGVDWWTLFRVVVDRYADRLDLLDYLLNSTTHHNAQTRARTVQRHLRVMLTPYILFSARPSTAADDDAWAGPVWRACATRHTAYIRSSLNAPLTQSERLLLGALDETNREICRSVVRMWVAGVRAGFDDLLPVPAKETLGDEELSLVLEGWRADTQALMAWLNWSVWVKCRPACGAEEICYLPTWPYFWRSWDDVNNEEGQWKRPQPRCIRQFEPYSPL
ncbi:hypothetical protein DFH06DRAFT_1018177 [Mycena polygramma]|nr:hypothetical protein DFH06DRAFT_1018177 [Mycena polygramma]